LIFPLALVVMFGRMLTNLRHAAVLYGVMMVLFLPMIGWAVYWDTLQPNPALTGHDRRTYEVQDAAAESGRRVVAIPEVARLPVDQELRNPEGQELPLGTSASATFSP